MVEGAGEAGIDRLSTTAEAGTREPFRRDKHYGAVGTASNETSLWSILPSNMRRSEPLKDAETSFRQDMRLMARGDLTFGGAALKVVAGVPYPRKA
jgi:hypothetical protein